MHTVFWLENLKRRGHSKDLDVDENIILEWVREIGWKSVDWMHLT